MKGRSVRIVAAMLLACATLSCSARVSEPSSRTSGPVDRTALLRQAIEDGRARSVILLVGDGLGDSEITMARNYRVGAAGRLALDSLPLTGAYTTYAVQEENPALPNYVTDSAAGATAWATGHKTSNWRIATAAGTDLRLKTILELAQKKGFRTGIVTTAKLSDATPAAFAAHVNHRSCQGPADMARCPQYRKAAGGAGSIAEQTVDHHVDVLLGGGRDCFDEVIDAGPYAGQTIVQSAIAQGYTVVTDAAALSTAQPAGKLLGLFAATDMSLEWRGERAAPFPGNGPQHCVKHRRPRSEPSLAAMTRKAIARLAPQGESRRHGFFLMVEGASIDKAAHDADPCGQIGETVAFDAAVGAALSYARRHPRTLVVVTSDHGQAGQIIPAPEATAHSPGAFSTLITVDGAHMTVSYATNLSGQRQEHTGTQVRVAAQGPQAANVVGVIDQTDLFYTMARALGIIRTAEKTGLFHAIAGFLGLD